MTLCLACTTKSETREATTFIAAGHRVWPLCGEHEDRFGALLADALQADGLQPPVLEKVAPTAVVTGRVLGYLPEDARRALTNAGYEVEEEVTARTALIVVGLTHDPALTRRAAQLGTPCLDAGIVGRFREGVTTGEWARLATDPYPDGATPPQPTQAPPAGHEPADEKSGVEAPLDEDEDDDPAGDADAHDDQDEKFSGADAGDGDPEVLARQRAATQSADRWREEVNRRMAKSAEEWAVERKEKEEAAYRRHVSRVMGDHLTETQRIRAWARKEGIKIRDRGRIPEEIKAAYHMAASDTGQAA